MPSKSRFLSRLITGEGAVKISQIDSDAVGVSASKSITAAAGTATYSSSDTLPTSATNGDQALVTSTNRLYIFTNGGWYNIALVNTSPYFTTSPNASYELSNTGAQTNIEILAVDSEGINITYSTVADSDFSTFATITKDSDNGRRFTITVDSDQSVGATGTVTFRASDGVNIASALSTFSIEFLVTNSNYTVLLLKADSDGTNNQVDASSIGRTITQGGNITSSAFTPYAPGGYSAQFDGGTTTRLTLPSDAGFAFGTGAYTVEAWVYISTSTTGAVIFDAGVANGSFSFLEEGGQLKLSKYGTGVQISSSAGAVNTNQWHHCAIVRTSNGANDTRLYVDGVLVGTGTDANNWTVTTTPSVGGANLANYTINGYIRDLRVVKGTAVYTTAFTPPTEPLTAITNTEILTCHLAYFADGSTNSHSITVAGNTNTERFGPYIHYPYTKTSHGGSTYFDGSGDYYRAPFSITGESNITVEAWIYMESLSVNAPIYSQYPDANATDYPGRHMFYIGSSDSKLAYWVADDGTAQHSEVLKLNTWYHVAYVKSGNTVTLYVNGKGETSSITFDRAIYNENINLVAEPHNSNYIDGYVSDYRINYNSTTYDSDFTPPTAPLTSSSDTKLLTFTNKNDIWDAAIGARMSKGGNTTASDTEAKFTTSGRGAIYFDGTNDYLDIYPASNLYALGSKDFTIDMWVNFTVASADTTYRRFFMADDGGNIANNFQLLVDAGGFGSQGAVMVWAQNGSNSNSDISSTTAINDGNWHHIAVSRTSGTVRLFVDGVRQGTNLTSWTHGFTGIPVPRLGSDATTTSGNYQGYIQDFRLMVGKSLYTSDSNITVPTAEFKG